MRSIRARLMIALIVLVAAASAVAATVTYRRVLLETSALFDYQLRQMALSLRGQISLAPRIEIPPDQGDTDFVIQIWDIFGTRTYLSRPGLPMINQTVLGYADMNLKGQPWRAYGLQTAQGVIQIAQPVRVRERLASAAALRILVPLLLLLPVMIGAAAWVVGRGLRPLRRLTADVQQRDAGSLIPLPVDGLPIEIEPLVGELNRLLSRLGEAFTAQRSFIADAAHELRSPLTALRLQLQLLDRAPDAAARVEARAQLGQAIERSIRLVEQLLTLARSEHREQDIDLDLVDLGTIAAQGIADTHSLATSRGIAPELVALSPVIARGDAESLRVLVRNLIDNAVRYTPEGGWVRLRCATSVEGAVLEVCDSGPGIPPLDRERVFDRFFRRARGQDDGSGLGLAIVKAIADRHHARVEVGAADGGGLRVSLRFPPSS